MAKIIVRATKLNNKYILSITSWGKLVSHIGEALFYYKLGQTLFQIGTVSLLQIGAAITNSGDRYYKIGHLLQIGAKFIKNLGRYYKLEQLLQIVV